MLGGWLFAVAAILVLTLPDLFRPVPGAGALLGGLAAAAYGMRAPMLLGAPLLLAAGTAAIPLPRRWARDTT